LPTTTRRRLPHCPTMAIAPRSSRPLRVVRVPRSAQALRSTRLCCIAPSPLITARLSAWRRPSLALRRFCCRWWRRCCLSQQRVRYSRFLWRAASPVPSSRLCKRWIWTTHAVAMSTPMPRWSPCLSVLSRSARSSSAKWRCWRTTTVCAASSRRISPMSSRRRLRRFRAMPSSSQTAWSRARATCATLAVASIVRRAAWQRLSTISLRCLTWTRPSVQLRARRCPLGPRSLLSSRVPSTRSSSVLNRSPVRRM